MGSTTVTYGKKRNLLRSLGSRRPFATATIDSSRRTSRKRTVGEPQSIDEMASRLLDDSTVVFHGQGEDVSPNKRRATAIGTPTPVGGDQAISPLALPPPVEKPLVPTESHIRSSRVGKYSPKSSGRVPRRAATARVRGDSSQKRKDLGLKRPLGPTRALSLDPLKFHPTNNLKVSTSVPLSAVDGNVRHRTTEDPKTKAASADADGAAEINQKLSAMLAATDALKPSPPRPVPSSSSRLTRMVPSKVFAKVSSAWDRLNSKPSLQEISTRDKVPLDEQDCDKLARWESAPPPSPNNMSPISTIEIRLNEGDNLNKSKVRWIVGGRVTRKPVADDGKSLRSGKSLEDPFADGDWRTLTSFETRLKMGAKIDESAIPPLPRNPFESEKGFDNDIEDRILNSTPVGSSTPRIRVQRASASSSDQSLTTQTTKFVHKHVSVRLSGTSIDYDKMESARGTRSRLALIDTDNKALVDSVAGARLAWESMAGEVDALGSKRVKKHPSPSKEALETLEVAFRKYTNLRFSGANIDDLDELATSFIATSPSLKPYEKKRLSSRRLSVTDMEELVGSPLGKSHHRAGSSSSMFALAGASKSLKDPIKLHREIRLAPPYRPAGFSPHEVDELQQI
ncbi:hypothetical protein FDECE_10650 [Fusarium decemcellulare]|nr:hypothetical protein FDECE_10650 [Fusarium decemcellulare]